MKIKQVKDIFLVDDPSWVDDICDKCVCSVSFCYSSVAAHPL